jgi:predicted hydrocarbon binding protein/KaiC/GvpD/RAD55 family RecA-like ATPase
VLLLVSLSQLQEVPSKQMLLLVGPPGSGKSAFCKETTLKNIVLKPVIYVTTESTSVEIAESFKQRGLGEVLPHPLGFVDAFQETVGLPGMTRADTIYTSCEDLTSLNIAISEMGERIGENALVIFDSLTSPYLMNGPEIVRFIRTTLLKLAVEGNAVLTCIDEGCGKAEDLVAMMSLANGIIKIEVEKDRRLLNVIKHPKLNTTRIEVPMTPSIDLGIDWAGPATFDLDKARQFFQAQMGKDEAFLRKEIGDFVNLFWPNLAHWSGMLWDPKRFPTMIYETNKEEPYNAIKEYWPLFPRKMRYAFKLFVPKNFSKVKDMKRMFKFLGGGEKPFERNWIVEYLEDISKTDEHYVRIHESYECWGFKNIGTKIASHLGPESAGIIKGFEGIKGLERDWNAVETKCIGLGNPYCEFKFVPGEIDGLKDSLHKDSPVIEKIHERLMHHLMAFLLEGKPLVERPRLGSDIYIHPVMHAMGFPAIAGERYRMALRMGGVMSGKKVGERLIDAGLRDVEAVKRVLHFLDYCKVGKVAVDETIRIEGSCESVGMLLATKREEPCCLFTTGFLNGFFSTVNNRHVKETKCIAMGDPYCEWEFR